MNVRNTAVATLLAAVLIAGAAATPTSALTVADIQAQIQGLLLQIASLRGQTTVQSNTAVVVSPSSQHRVCSALYRNLSLGLRGDDVLALQEYLQAQGYFYATPTGYYGRLTAQAVANWQASQGIAAVGAVGPLTRARISASCGQSGGGPVACTQEYAPVCGRPKICDTPGVGAYPRECDYGQTYSNRCQLNAAGASFLYEGACRSTPSTDPSADPRCKSWYDGCNDCSRESPGGSAACTLRYCVWQAPAYCKAYFDSSANRPPSISSFSGPTVLNINQTGTWSVQASDPENGPLSYRISWGDQYYPAPMASGYAADAFIQTTTFTHAYASAGTYTISITVRDSSGQEIQTTTTVRVDNAPLYCTMEYAPVCGQKTTCPACYYSEPACLAPCYTEYKTYSNRCLMNSDGATFAYEGQCQTQPVACTADARQCPDGTWVGRTGPNCQFVCPGGYTYP